MLDRMVRRLAAYVAVQGVLGLGMLPAEHIHAAVAKEGRHTEVVHRHVAAHHGLGSSAEFDHDADHRDAVWVDSSFVSPGSIAHDSPATDALPEHLHDVSPARTSCGTSPPPAISGHDPPWARSYALRAPPSLV